MEIEKIGRVSSASVQKGTGRDWVDWVKLLDKAGARHWTHQEIVAYLKKRYKLGPWWQQGVTHGYEIHIGRRIEGRNEKGEYALTSSRTFPLSKKNLWRLLTSPEGIAIWLKPLSDFHLTKGESFECEGGIFGEVRTMKAGERARLTWRDAEEARPSVLQIMLIPRQGHKSILVFQHDQLRDARLKERMRSYWKKVLEDLLRFVTQNSQ